MSITPKMQYLLINAAIVTACIIQLLRNKPLIIVIVAAITFAIVGNFTIWRGGSKRRAIERQRKIDYYSQ